MSKVIKFRKRVGESYRSSYSDVKERYEIFHSAPFDYDLPFDPDVLNSISEGGLLMTSGYMETKVFSKFITTCKGVEYVNVVISSE